MIVDVIIILTLIYYIYDPYSKLRRSFEGYKSPPVEQYDMCKQSFIIFGPSNTGKTTFIKGLAKLYDIVYVFCCNKKGWNRYGTYYRNDLVLLKNIEIFAFSLFIIDVMGDNIRKLAEDVLFSRGRQHGTSVIAAPRTITDLNPKSRDDSSIAYNTLKGSNEFNESEFNELRPTLTERVIKPVVIKRQELIF